MNKGPKTTKAPLLDHRKKPSSVIKSLRQNGRQIHSTQRSSS